MLSRPAAGLSSRQRETALSMRPLRDILSTEATLAGLIDRRRRDLAILDLVQKTLPAALGAQVGIADATRDELVLATATGAAATLVRHRAPELLNSLTREGWKFTGIRVRVQARSTPGHRSKVYAKQMDEEVAAGLRAGADRIEDPRLAAALRRLARRGRSGSKDEQRPFESVEDEHAKQKK